MVLPLLLLLRRCAVVTVLSRSWEDVRQHASSTVPVALETL